MEMETLLSLAKYTLPPAAGALIGYCTNTVAIRMLFRPYRAWRVGPVRIPFTPGVIPRNRETLAESIAGMVSQELIQPEIVTGHLRSPGVQAGLRRYSRSLVDRAAAFSLRRRYPSLPPARILQAWRSPAAAALRRTLLMQLAAEADKRRLGELPLPGDDRIWSFIAPFLEKAFSGQAFSGQADDGIFLRAVYRDPALISRPVDSFLPEGWQEDLEGLLGQIQPAVLRWWEQWRDQPAVRRELEDRGRRILQESLDQLSGLQRLMVTAGQYDRSLSEKMPRIVEAFLRQADEALRQEDRPRKLAQWAAERSRDVRRETLGELLERWGGEGSGASSGSSGSGGSSASGGSGGLGLLGKDLLEAARPFLVKGAESFFRQGMAEVRRMSFGDLLRRGLEKEPAAAAEELLAYSEGRKGSRRAAALICRLYRRLPAKSVEEMISLDEPARDKAAEFLVVQGDRLMTANMAPLLGHLDIHSMVVRRINSLEMDQVDRLIQIVIARHLKWINLFGAILGFLIGLSQLLFLLVS